jgi:hypothetical protein
MERAEEGSPRCLLFSPHRRRKETSLEENLRNVTRTSRRRSRMAKRRAALFIFTEPSGMPVQPVALALCHLV